MGRLIVLCCTTIAIVQGLTIPAMGTDRSEAGDLDFEAHVAKLRTRLPSDEFHIVVEKPFVVIGDGGVSAVERSAKNTVQWAVRRIKKAYFKDDPDHIIDIWLFKNEESYRAHTKALFNDTPTTPFGYYSPTHRALIMNIATGGGTLVHEIVHPFIAANFPKCPSWFNEGLASLYEQCQDRGGSIWGSTNWRLRGLQEAIGKGTVPSFRDLTSTSRREFYNSDRGTNYAQARYLCYYLQQRRLLVKYYQEFRKNAEEDPTGYLTLRRLLGNPEMDEFQSEWETFVMKLKFP